jgi:hypothetical protein
LASLAGLGAVVAYSAASSARFPGLIVGVGAAGLVLACVALLGGWPSLFPLGVVGVGAAYAITLAFRSTGVDPRAPFVAAGIFVAAECAYFSLGWGAGRPDRRLTVRRLLHGLAAAVAAALVGALVLVAASKSTSGLALEAGGITAALVILLLLAVLSSRTST